MLSKNQLKEIIIQRPLRHNVDLWKEVQAHLDEAALTRSGSAVRLLNAIERILFGHCQIHDPSGECGSECCNCQFLSVHNVI